MLCSAECQQGFTILLSSGLFLNDYFLTIISFRSPFYDHPYALTQPMQKNLNLTAFILVLACASVPQAFASPPDADPQSADWVQANKNVGQFLRGHIDVLKAESKSKAKSSQPASATTSTAQYSPLTLEQAKRLALEARPSLFLVGSESLVDQNQQSIKVTELMTHVERAWVNAVGSELILKFESDATESTKIAQELAFRMGKVGNWEASKVIDVSLQAAAQQLKLVEVQQKTANARQELVNLIMTDSFTLPNELPAIRGLGARSDLNTSPSELAQMRLNRLPDYEGRLMALKRLETSVGQPAIDQWQSFASTQISTALTNQTPSTIAIDRTKILWQDDLKAVLHQREALNELTWQTATTIAMAQTEIKSRHMQVNILKQELVPLSNQSEEEAIYKYNGMFIGTWKLLDHYREKIEANIALVSAQLAYWNAEYAYAAYIAGASYAPSK